MVAVFLLHAGGFSGLRSGLPECDPIGAARVSEGGGYMRHGPRGRRATPRRRRSRSASRLYRSNTGGQQLQVEGVRSRGHDPVVRASPARNRSDQVHSETDHCRRHRLALLERAQTRAEGVTRAQGYWSEFVTKFLILAPLGWPVSTHFGRSSGDDTPWSPKPMEV